MPIIRTRHDKNNPYFMLNRFAAEDERLSFKAVGIHTYLMSKPDNWTVQEADLANRHADGATAVRSGLKELKDKGYIKIVKVTGEGGRITEWETHVYETPADSKATMWETHNLDCPPPGEPTSWEAGDIVNNDSLVTIEDSVTNEKTKDSSAAAEAPLPTNEHEQSGKSDKMSPLLNGSTKKTSANGTTTSSVQESLDERSEDTLPPSSEAPPSPHEDTPWQKQLKALCWVCFGHQELAMLTREDMGKLTREAKTVFTDKGYTTDELKRWWQEDWKPIWKARDGSRPEPSYVRSHIASVRNKQKEFTVGFEKVSGDNWYAEDDDGGDVAKMDCPVWFPPDLWDFADDWQRGEILDARECDRAEWADLIAENREDARQKALSQV